MNHHHRLRSDDDLHPFQFQANCSGMMEFKGSAQRVEEYLTHHQGWFPRCAHPLQSCPLGDNGYVLVLGCYSFLGHQIEPKVGLVLGPESPQNYWIEAVPVPDYDPGYQVDFFSTMSLVPVGNVTQVQWHLKLDVFVHLPRFFYTLPHSLVVASGHRLLLQVIRQVSHRLTCRVQEDFHRVGLQESFDATCL